MYGHALRLTYLRVLTFLPTYLLRAAGKRLGLQPASPPPLTLLTMAVLTTAVLSAAAGPPARSPRRDVDRLRVRGLPPPRADPPAMGPCHRLRLSGAATDARGGHLPLP